MGKLTALKVQRAKPGVHGDGAGLYLRVKPSGARSWVLRVQVAGRRQDIGLGSTAQTSLAEAREEAARLRKAAKRGQSPVAERDRDRLVVPTFAQAVVAAHSELSKGWSQRTARAFKASLTEHAVPKLGALRVDAIGSSDVIAAMAAIWADKPVMARTVRGRIMQVLAFAKARGWRSEALPDAREMRSGLSKQARGGNFAAMPFAQVPGFVAAELGKDLVSSRAAVLFAILTAARSGEVRRATWDQVDLDARTWSRPAAVMKMGQAHVVTLNDAAIALLERHTPPELREGLLFPGLRGGPLSDMSLTRMLRLAGSQATVHGFRSGFRDFAAERMPMIPGMVAEMALAHKVGTATEQAYLRTDLRDMRRALMDGWGRFVAPSLSGAAGNVAELRRPNARAS
jgi:integrase